MIIREQAPPGASTLIHQVGTDIRNMAAFRADSLALSRFQHRDFTDVRTVMRRLFPKSYNRKLERDVPLVWYFGLESSKAYLRPPVVEYQGIDPAWVSLWQDARRAMDLDARFLAMHERLSVQQTMIGLLLPTPGGIALRWLEPWEVEVDPDPYRPGDLQAASEIRALLPVAMSDGATDNGLLVMNRDKIVLRGQRDYGVFAEDGRNVLGGYPAFVARLGEPRQGFFVALPTDLKHAQIAVNIGYSDLDHIVRNTSWGLKTFTGMRQSDAQDIELNPDTVLGLADGEKVEIVTGSLQASEYMASIEKYIADVVRFNNKRPDVFAKTYVNALSRRLDMVDSHHVRMRHYGALQAAEQGCAEAYARIDRWMSGGLALPVPTLQVTYVEPTPPADPQNEAVAAEKRAALGLESIAEQVAAERGISLAEAEAVVRRNRMAERGAMPQLEGPSADA